MARRVGRRRRHGTCIRSASSVYAECTRSLPSPLPPPPPGVNVRAKIPLLWTLPNETFNNFPRRGRERGRAYLRYYHRAGVIFNGGIRTRPRSRRGPPRVNASARHAITWKRFIRYREVPKQRLSSVLIPRPRDSISRVRFILVQFNSNVRLRTDLTLSMIKLAFRNFEKRKADHKRRGVLRIYLR